MKLGYKENKLTDICRGDKITAVEQKQKYIIAIDNLGYDEYQIICLQEC